MSQGHNHLNHATWECKYHVVFPVVISSGLGAEEPDHRHRAVPAPPPGTPPPRSRAAE
jgi:hypothetical protein